MAVKPVPFPGMDRLPTLRTERLVLRWIEERDAPALREVFGDPEVMRYWSAPPLPDEAAALELVVEIQSLFRQRTLFQWGIVRAEEDQLLGTATLWRWELPHRRAEVGFALGRKSWGKGYMAETLTALIRCAFDDWELHRIEADTDPRNHRSLSVLERMGFRREGYLRERFHVGGEIQDSVVLGLLRSDWAANRFTGRR
jgi:ribosomal-protein-alanine N-acetyltransferase